MFETFNGTSTSVTSSTLIDSTQSFKIDFYKNWRITVNAIEYSITGNTLTDLNFSNGLSGTPTYRIEFMTREYLSQFDDQIVNTNLMPMTLIQSKILITKMHFEEKIYAYFKNQFETFDDPSSLILNLYHIQIPFAYYCLADIYADLLLTGQDLNGYKEEKYRSAYKDIIKDSLSLLAMDVDQTNELTKEEKETSRGTGFFSR